jgi:hypothetical protein
MLRVLTIAAFLVVSVLGAGPSHAHIIDFLGGGGGIINYGGGASPLTGTDLPINAVYGIPPGQSSQVPVIGGELNFTTGAFLTAIDLPGDPFLSFFSTGGSVSITGAVPAAGISTDSLLLEGSFVSPPTFTHGGIGIGVLSGTLGISFLNQSIVDLFGFGSQPNIGPGVLVESLFNISFDSTNFGPTTGFSGTQNFVNVKAVVPQPVPLILVGSGLVGMWLVGGYLRRQL